LDVARDLLGKVLVHRTREGVASGMIVEAEAYIGEDDPACHAAPGPTKRNEPLYGPPGVAYVYLNYGMHYLVNVVTEAKGAPAAVLIRALAPLDGIPLMLKRRANGRAIHDAELCRGPGNLTKALGITLKENRLDLTSSRLWIEDRPRDGTSEVGRIGITRGGAAVAMLARGPSLGIRQTDRIKTSDGQNTLAEGVGPRHGPAAADGADADLHRHAPRARGHDATGVRRASCPRLESGAA
jgi:DNA-3-methyladenine glycosylase